MADPQANYATAVVRTKGLAWAMFWAVVSYIVTTLGAALTEYLGSFELTPLQGSLISTGVGLAVVMIGVMIDYAKSGGNGGNRPPVPPGPQQWQQPNQPRRQPARRTPWALAIVLILVLCGGGGLAVTYLGHWAAQQAVAAFERVSGTGKDKPGVERLAAPRTKTQGILTVTVTSVQVNDRATVVKVTAKNSGGEAMTLTGEQLTLQGATLKRDPFSGDWDRGEVPAQGEYTGTMVFDGRIPEGTQAATLAFTQIFSMDFSAPNNISIDLRLNVQATPVT